MNNIDRDALRAAASKATQGPWSCEPDERADRDGIQEIVGWDISSTSKEIVGCEGILGCGEANARYIALANPSAVLALLDENERMREACTEMLNGFQREIIENIEEDGDLHTEDGKIIKPLPHALRWLTHAAAAIRALDPPADAMAALTEVVRREVEREREANASLAEHLADKGVDNGSWDEGITNWEAAHIIAAAIRARAGETKA